MGGFLKRVTDWPVVIGVGGFYLGGRTAKGGGAATAQKRRRASPMSVNVGPRDRVIERCQAPGVHVGTAHVYDV